MRISLISATHPELLRSACRFLSCSRRPAMASRRRSQLAINDSWMISTVSTEASPCGSWPDRKQACPGQVLHQRPTQDRIADQVILLPPPAHIPARVVIGGDLDQVEQQLQQRLSLFGGTWVGGLAPARSRERRTPPRARRRMASPSPAYAPRVSAPRCHRSSSVTCSSGR